MAKYFTSVYKNYYDKILNSNIKNNSSLLNDKIVMLDNSINNYKDFIESSSWSETGKNDLLSLFMTNVNKDLNTIKNDYSSINRVNNLVGNDLLLLLKELKEKDELYITTQEEVRNGATYKQSELVDLDKELIALVNKIDRKILEIKNTNNDDKVVSSAVKIDSNVNSSSSDDGLRRLEEIIHGKNDDNDKPFLDRLKEIVNDNKSKKQLKTNKLETNKLETNKLETDNKTITRDNSSSTKSLGNVSTMSLLGSNYSVIKSAMSPVEYQKYAYDKGIRQNSNTERYSDLCLAFSYVHASNIYNNYLGDNAESAYNWKHAGEFYDYFSDSKSDTLGVVYDQIMEGKPVILQVNGNKSGTSRHFVTVVGLKEGTTKSSISEGDLLIIDSWDGKLERMDQSTSRFMTTGKDTHKSYTGYYLRVLK